MAKQDEKSVTHTSQVEAKDAAIALLKEGIASLTDANQRLRQRLDSEWGRARAMWTLGAAVLGVLFAVNLYNQYLATAELKGRADDLRLQTQESKRELAKVTSTSAQLLDRSNELSKTLATSADASDRTRRTSIEVYGAVHRVISLLNSASTQLVYKHNARRARLFADQAADVLREAKRTAQDEQPLQDAIDTLSTNILLMQAESALRMREMSDLERIAADIIVARCGTSETACDQQEGQYFLGLAKLHGASSEKLDVERRRRLLFEAIEALAKSLTSAGEGSVGLVFLSGACFSAGQFGNAMAHSRDFLHAYPPSTEDRRRLGSEIRAQIGIAEAWQAMSQYVLGETNDCGTFGCQIDVGAIGESESVILEEILDDVIRQRARCVPDDYRANAIGVYAVDVIVALQRACNRTDACCAPSPEQGTHRDALLAKYALRKFPQLPVMSRDPKLGRTVDGAIRMVFLDARDEHEEPTPYRAEWKTAQEIAPHPYVPYAEDLWERARNTTPTDAAPMPPAPTADPSA